jgi:hypothetical protein
MRERRRTSAAALVAVAAALALPLAGCTPAEAAPWGKVMLGLMACALIAIPIVFYRTWRRR